MSDKGCKNWLIVSDVDGTLNDKYRRTVKANIDAIAEFTGKGGLFTIASGRNLQSALKIYNRLNIKTPLIFLNGAGIYDPEKSVLLSYQSISSDGQAVVFGIAQQWSCAELIVHTRDMIYLVKPRLFGKAFTLIDNLDHKVCQSLFEVPKGDWGKITIFDKPQNIELINLMVNRKSDLDVKSVPTSSFTLEIIDKATDKGNSVKRLAQILSIDMKKTAAIGDYYNDLDMLKAVAFPACCAKAPTEVKAVSKYCAGDADKGAVADFIRYLTKNYITNCL